MSSVPKTRRVKVKLTEMMSPDVQWISVVSRAASRIPFRVLKAEQENAMLNLNNLGRVLKGEPAKTSPTAEVLAVVTMHQDDETTDKVKAALEGHGIPVVSVEKSDEGTVIYKSSDADLTQGRVLKVSDETLVVLKGFDSYADGLSFMDAATARQFMPSLYSATDVLTSLVSRSLCDAKSPEDVAKTVATLTSEFVGYVGELAKSLPKAVFKADEEVQSVMKAAKEKAAKKPADPAVDPEGDGDKDGKACAKKEDGEAPVAEQEGVPETTTGEQAPVTPAQSGEELALVQKSIASVAEQLTGFGDGFKALTAALEGLRADVERVSKAQETTDQKVAEISKKADTASQAVQSTIVAAAPAGDTPAGAVVKKADDTDPRTGTFDTAFLRRGK